MKAQLIARLSIFAAIALAAVFAASYTPSQPAYAKAARSGGDAAFSLTLDTLDGNRYILDTGLTLEDCGARLDEKEGRGWGCQRESEGAPL